ncbi:hypothetical protein AAFF_G00224080 [Aldrovandia affinis]|uniref:Uncharacterized protein n=1 Tax=Aldrovandia affinis TaxID=143900 RepID=A0AAD7TAX4_9TELE|nr:hypothetical protein AAFF_G00224080 [Aldrovandia affinis]
MTTPNLSQGGPTVSVPAVGRPDNSRHLAQAGAVRSIAMASTAWRPRESDCPTVALRWAEQNGWWLAAPGGTSDRSQPLGVADNGIP